jgi:hypothetical protein
MKIKLPISTLAWLLIINSIYLVVGMINIFAYKFTETEYIQAVWILILSLPLWLPMGKIINMDPIWKQI